MISLLLDTNLLIEEPHFGLLAENQDDIEVQTSVLCYAELLEGEFSNDPVKAAQAIIQLASAHRLVGDGIPFGTAELQAYRAICAAVTRAGRTLTRARRVDMMIAATALANGLTLATRNVDDFAAVQAIVPVIEL